MNKDKCKSCGLCKKFCPVSAISLGPANVPNEPSENCIGCGRCAVACNPRAIEYTDTKEQRSIWGRQFKLLRCASCGKYFATEKEFALARSKAGSVYGGAGASSGANCAAICEVCRRKKSADVFAAAFGERI